jgi:hypothetical protein
MKESSTQLPLRYLLLKYEDESYQVNNHSQINDKPLILITPYKTP